MGISGNGKFLDNIGDIHLQGIPYHAISILSFPVNKFPCTNNVEYF